MAERAIVTIEAHAIKVFIDLAIQATIIFEIAFAIAIVDLVIFMLVMSPKQKDLK